eukprot:SAG22_NODE_389_length_11276_cov_12.397244_5_plen_191_part_00
MGGAGFATHWPRRQVPHGCEWQTAPSGLGLAAVHRPPPLLPSSAEQTPATSQSVSGGGQITPLHGSHPFRQHALLCPKKRAPYPQPPFGPKQNAGLIPALQPYGNELPFVLHIESQLTVQLPPDQPCAQSQRAVNSLTGVQLPCSPQSVFSHGLLSQVTPEYGGSHSQAAASNGHTSAQEKARVEPKERH